MSEFLVSGPRQPSRLIFIAVSVVAATVGIVTMDHLSFVLAFFGSMILLCSAYALLRRWLGWRPLSADYLSHLFNVLVP